MKIILIDEDGTELWWWQKSGAMMSKSTSESYVHDGTLWNIIAFISEALQQSQAELDCFQVTDAVPNVCATTTEIDSYIPMTGMRHGNLGRKRLIKTAVICVASAAAVRAKISVIHNADVALVRAFDNDSVAGV
jgi:hypothetical protein